MESNEDRKLGGREFFEKYLNSPRHIMAPMVDASDLAYRILSRRYNTHLTYTPMLYSRVFANSAKYRQRELRVSPEDRPLVVQFCGTTIEDLLPAALIAQHECDAIDINLGCPQFCAIKGGYGAYLLEHPSTVFSIVSTLSKHLSVPVFCKMRILTSEEKTIEFAQGLEQAGCQLLVVHGRTKEQKGRQSGPCNWDIIKKIKQALTIPVVANGGIQKFEDVDRCISYTGCDAVMSADAMLRNPAFFGNVHVDPCDLVLEYLQICKRHSTSKQFINAHVYGLLIEPFQLFPEIRNLYKRAKTLDDIINIITELKTRVEEIKQKNLEENIITIIPQYLNETMEKTNG